MRIVTGHFNTLRDYSTGRTSAVDVGIFFVFPAIVSLVGWYFKWAFYIDSLNAVLAAFAIFAGLLLNLLILIYTFSADGIQANPLQKVRILGIKELHDNISFAVLVSMCIVVVTLVSIAALKI
jgi:hypothetical protein